MVDAVEEALREDLGLVAERRRHLHRVRRGAALVLQVLVPARLVRAPLGLVLEGLLGVDGEEAQGRVEPLHADGVAVDDRVLGRERELADDEPGRLEAGELLLRRPALLLPLRGERLGRRGTTDGDERRGPDH